MRRVADGSGRAGGAQAGAVSQGIRGGAEARRFGVPSPWVDPRGLPGPAGRGISRARRDSPGPAGTSSRASRPRGGEGGQGPGGPEESGPGPWARTAGQMFSSSSAGTYATPRTRGAPVGPDAPKRTLRSFGAAGARGLDSQVAPIGRGPGGPAAKGASPGASRRP